MQFNANKNDGESLQTNTGMKMYMLRGLYTPVKTPIKLFIMCFMHRI